MLGRLQKQSFFDSVARGTSAEKSLSKAVIVTSQKSTFELLWSEFEDAQVEGSVGRQYLTLPSQGQSSQLPQVRGNNSMQILDTLLGPTFV